MSEIGKGDEGQNMKDFPFIRERIKEKPVSKRRLAIHFMLTVTSAIIFGVVACLVFTILQPKMELWFASGDATVSIPQDDEKTAEEPEVEKEVIVETQQLETTDYQAVYTKMYAIGKKANRSVVKVTGVTSETDWTDSSYESEGYSSGLIIAKNDNKLLILTEHKVIEKAEDIRITFVNDETCKATLKKYDGNTGLAVLSVDLDDIDDSTMDDIDVATLGNSYQVGQGKVVLAIGSPLGNVYSILTGTITSASNEISTTDHVYTLFTTDMVGTSSGSGVLINLDGEVIGVILQDYSNEDDQNTITAISVSELKSVIEGLSNGNDIPYVGANIATVSEDIASEYEIPQGVYVKSVELDSPAISGGIQTGDVIISIDDNSIGTVEEYETWLKEAEVDDEVTIIVKRFGNGEYKEVKCPVKIGTISLK